MSWPWSQLGLSGPSDLSQVRRAYAEKLKITHPEEDPEGFQRLHSAYQLASRMARQQARAEKLRSAPPVDHPPQGEERPAPEEDREFDFDELLEEGESPRRPREEERDFDFDELLEEGESPRRPREEEERDFDFDELLEEGESPRRPREEERDFDFDRLFAEGEAERAEARRRRGEERRKAREQERFQRQQQRSRCEEDLRWRFHQEQRHWQDTETILHTIEMLYAAGAKPEAWRKFFESPLFQQNRGSLDLIFGLEDFVSGHPDLSQDAKTALYLAFGFDKGVSRPELRPLYQMLLPAWRGEQDKKYQQRLYRLGTVIGGVILVPVGLALLASGWLLAVLVLAVVAVFTLMRLSLRGVFSKGPLGQKRGLSVGMIATIVCLAAAVSMALNPGLWEKLDRSSKSSDPRARVCGYMEQDYGVTFRTLYSENAPRFDNVFFPADQPNHLFLAGPDGEREIEAGRPGYTTNYPDMMVLWAMEDFAKAHGLREVDLMNRNQNLESWETSGTYLIVLPFYGAGETITDLGELLEDLAGEDWYQFGPPSFKLVLCSEQMAAGRLILQEYESTAGEFDGAEVREVYESSFAQSYCAQILQECELDRDFTRSAPAEAYTLVNGGIAELLGKTCCKVYGLDENGQTAMEYYMDVNSDRISNLYCVPGGFWEEGGTEEQIHFYRLVHRETELGLIYLYYPWLIQT